MSNEQLRTLMDGAGFAGVTLVRGVLLGGGVLQQTIDNQSDGFTVRSQGDSDAAGQCGVAWAVCATSTRTSAKPSWALLRCGGVCVVVARRRFQL